MGWKLRDTLTMNANEENSNTLERLLDLARRIEESRNEQETQFDYRASQMNNFRRRRCGIQHGVSGRSGVLPSPFFILDSSNRLQITGLPS